LPIHVELRLSGSDLLLTHLEFEELHKIPVPGLWIEVDSQPLLVTQRRHRYGALDR